MVGKKIVVLYFYPADFTGGCTTQACGFRDDIEKLGSKGVMVIGVSGDSVETHKLFKAHHKLPFTLLADEKGEIAKKFGVPVGKGGRVADDQRQGGQNKGHARRDDLALHDRDRQIGQGGRRRRRSATPPATPSASRNW